MARLRIGIFGMSQEAMLATPGFLDPHTVLVSRGAEIIHNDLWIARGIVAVLQADPAVEIVPLMLVRCRAAPQFSRAFFETCKAETLAMIAEQGPFDGLVAANHGAMEVEDLTVSGDTDLIGAVRAAVGPDVPIALALDMHGHLSPALLRDAQAFAVFRTAPHRDDDSTGARAARMLLRVLHEGIAPRSAAVHVPMFLPGEMAMTEFEPMRSLYAALTEYEQRPGVLGVDYMVGFAWNDRPWIGMTAVATTSGNAAQARALALELADTLWNRRHEFRMQMVVREVNDGLLEAGELAHTGPVFLSDAGDNVTAGAYGDLTLVLQAALALPQIGPITVVNIVAPETVAACQAAGVGGTVMVQIGREHLSRPAIALAAHGAVEACGDVLDLATTHYVRGPTAPWARVRFGHVVATFHARRLQITSPAQTEAMGIDVRAPGIFVFKVGYLHPDQEAVAARHILLLSDGTSNLDLTRLEYRQIARPAFPFDPDMEWQPVLGLYDDGQG